MLDVLVAALFPLRCPGCGRAAEPVCSACAAGLRAPYPAPPPAGVERWAAAFAYEGVARELVARAKYRNARGALPWLAGAMADAASAANLGAVDMVTDSVTDSLPFSSIPTSSRRACFDGTRGRRL